MGYEYYMVYIMYTVLIANRRSFRRAVSYAGCGLPRLVKNKSDKVDTDKLFWRADVLTHTCLLYTSDAADE